MWQQNNPKSRKKSRQTQRKRKGPKLHIKRVGADIRLIGGEQEIVLEGRLVLNELSPTSISIFSTKCVPSGQDVAITLEEPSGVYLRGRVVECRDFNSTSHVLTSTPFQWRMTVRLTFESAEEERRMREFCAKLAREAITYDDDELKQAA